MSGILQCDRAGLVCASLNPLLNSFVTALSPPSLPLSSSLLPSPPLSLSPLPLSLSVSLSLPPSLSNEEEPGVDLGQKKDSYFYACCHNWAWRLGFPHCTAALPPPHQTRLSRMVHLLEGLSLKTSDPYKDFQAVLCHFMISFPFFFFFCFLSCFFCFFLPT